MTNPNLQPLRDLVAQLKPTVNYYRDEARDEQDPEIRGQLNGEWQARKYILQQLTAALDRMESQQSTVGAGDYCYHLMLVSTYGDRICGIPKIAHSYDIKHPFTTQPVDTCDCTSGREHVHTGGE